MMGDGMTFKELLELYVVAEAERKDNHKWYRAELDARWKIGKELEAANKLVESLTARNTELENTIGERDKEISTLQADIQSMLVPIDARILSGEEDDDDEPF